MNDRYILDGHRAVPCDDLTKWAAWFESSSKDRVVQLDTIKDARISTVFLGLDHRFTPEGPPMLFETMIFGGEHSDFQERYTTWDEALAGHQRALALVAGKLTNP